MKFMGSKRWMLKNGLGELLRRETRNRTAFVDLFTGSATVAAFVARERSVKVTAYDLQAFSVDLANAILCRTKPLNASLEWNQWRSRATAFIRRRGLEQEAVQREPVAPEFTRQYVDDQRGSCGTADEKLLITRAYGGHYFSRRQAVWLDAMRATAPRSSQIRSVAIAALLHAASECAASPGHTAQPFQPTRSAKRFLREAWERDMLSRTKAAFLEIGSQFAQRKGEARIGDANEQVEHLRPGDLVFVDPPYSGVHYSRFYHVLETIALGRAITPSGTGRYPPAEQRPWSRFSVKSESEDAIADLLEGIAQCGATAVVTFPDKRCSNGISGDYLREIAEESFREVHEYVVVSRFSTLGGNGHQRDARQKSKELILLLRP